MKQNHNKMAVSTLWDSVHSGISGRTGGPFGNTIFEETAIGKSHEQKP